MFIFAIIGLVSASVDRLPRLIDAVKGNRIIKRGGIEMPRALYEATEAHRRLIEKLYLSSDKDSAIFNEILDHVNSIRVPCILTPEQISRLRDNALQSARGRQEVRRATEDAINLHGKLATLFNFRFSAVYHLEILDILEGLLEKSLEQMIASFTSETCLKYGHDLKAAALAKATSLSQEMVDVRVAYADWVYPSILQWPVTRKVTAAIAAFEKSIEHIEDSDSDEINASDAFRSLTRAFILNFSGQRVYNTSPLKGQVVRFQFRRRLSPLFWVMNSGELRMLVRSLQGSLTKVQAKRWSNVMIADQSVVEAEQSMNRYAGITLSTPKTLIDAGELHDEVERAAQLAAVILAKRRNHRQSLRKFLNSF